MIKDCFECFSCHSMYPSEKVVKLQAVCVVWKKFICPFKLIGKCAVLETCILTKPLLKYTGILFKSHFNGCELMKNDVNYI